MTYNKNKLSLTELVRRAKSGNACDIEYLMENLELNNSFLNCKLIDHALSHVTSEEGKTRIKHFLFNGTSIQRNYAALFFKRLGIKPVIEEAVQQGCIDDVQAYSR